MLNQLSIESNREFATKRELKKKPNTTREVKEKLHMILLVNLKSKQQQQQQQKT